MVITYSQFNFPTHFLIFKLTSKNLYTVSHYQLILLSNIFFYLIILSFIQQLTISILFYLINKTFSFFSNSAYSILFLFYFIRILYTTPITSSLQSINICLCLVIYPHSIPISLVTCLGFDTLETTTTSRLLFRMFIYILMASKHKISFSSPRIILLQIPSIQLLI